MSYYFINRDNANAVIIHRTVYLTNKDLLTQSPKPEIINRTAVIKLFLGDGQVLVAIYWVRYLIVGGLGSN